MSNMQELSKQFRKKSPQDRLLELVNILNQHEDLSETCESEVFNGARAGSAGSTKDRASLEDFATSPQKKFLHTKKLLQANDELTGLADCMIECAVGSMSVPLGIVSGLCVDGISYHVPLATEEPSVLAAANYAAKIFANASVLEGVVRTKIRPPVQIAQIALRNVSRNGERAFGDFLPRLYDLLIHHLERMHKRGGGLRYVEYRRLASDLFVVHIGIDVRDAMGANVVNAAAEFVAPEIARHTGGVLLAAVLSNFSDQRLVYAEVELDVRKIPFRGLGNVGEAQTEKQAAKEIFAGVEEGDKNKSAMGEGAARIADMYRWAQSDVYRALTHNKGIMNAVSGLALATGNDTRAIEAASHALAAQDILNAYTRSKPDGAAHEKTYGKDARDAQFCEKTSSKPTGTGGYTPLSAWHFIKDTQILHGEIVLPALFATQGGSCNIGLATWTKKVLSINLKKPITAHLLNRVAATLGLAQNFAALLALTGEGIQKGHMKMHNKKYEETSSESHTVIKATMEQSTNTGSTEQENVKKQDEGENYE